MLGNIYTGSLYNGLISLLCDKTIDLSDKKVMLFSYGSGCAASMFFVHVKKGYQQHPLRLNAEFQERLDQRVKLSPEEYDQWMAHRESLFGIRDYEPTVSDNFSCVCSTFFHPLTQSFLHFRARSTTCSPAPST